MIMSTRQCILACLLAVSHSQDTYYCPDGWSVWHYGDTTECIMLGGVQELVTKADASILCQYHDGWVVDLAGDQEYTRSKNSHIKDLIVGADTGGGTPPGMQYSSQWWVGAEVSGHHGNHHWGNWTSDRSGAEITWFDWMRNEPNDWHEQNCLTYLKNQPLLGPGAYHWNDWDCDSTARYICQKQPHQESPSTSTHTISTTTTTITTTTTTISTITTTTVGPEECPFTSSPSLSSRSIFCPQSYCPAVIITSQGGAVDQQPASLGCYNYEGSLLGDEYPNYVHRSGLFLTPGEHTSPTIGYTTWIVSTEVLASNGTIRNIRHDSITCPYDLHDGWEYWDNNKQDWVEDITLTVTCSGHNINN